MTPTPDSAAQGGVTQADREGFAPCPTCHQWSHSLGTDQIAEALLHFESMYAHPVRGHPMGHHFDEHTRAMAQVLVTAARLSSSPPAQQAGVEDAPRLIERKLDAECGCPEEAWDTPWGELHMHLSPGRPSNACLDNGDEGERHIDLTTATIDEARSAIFGWASMLAATEQFAENANCPAPDIARAALRPSTDAAPDARTLPVEAATPFNNKTNNLTGKTASRAAAPPLNVGDHRGEGHD